jgi:phage virion morphogenesis protein
MVGVVLDTQLDSTAAEAALARLSPELLAQMSDEIGGLVAAQTMRRIAEDKTAPDGTPWAPWSARYEARIKNRQRGRNRSLLVGAEGNLQSGIHHLITGTDIKVGSVEEYAAVHQFGSADGRGIPARPYLGLSIADRTEIEDLIVTRVEEVLL